MIATLAVLLALSYPADPAAATCRIEVPMGAALDAAGNRVEQSSCGTATVVWPRRADGRWDVLTAAHCFPDGKTEGTVTLKDGRTFAVTLTHRCERSDLAWCVTRRKSCFMPWAKLGQDAKPGDRVWHNGFGWDKPGNTERGTSTGGNGHEPAPRLFFELNVSQGDSGGGVFDAQTGLLVGVVSSTSAPAQKASMSAGPASSAAACRPK
jgi:S1-C subfamily serine protease